MTTAPLLEVEQLEVAFGPPGRERRIVRGVSLQVRRGEVLGVIGESGSGKTMTMMAILRLLPEGMRTAAGRMRFDGIDLRGLRTPAFDALRGTRLAMVFQDPVGAFNPAKTIGWHLRTVMRRAAGGRKEARADRRRWRLAAIDLLGSVGVKRDPALLERYPHQLSGGMLQRALIAMVVALQPQLIVADEPTTNLDNIVERQIIGVFRELRARLDAAIVFITHDITIAGALCDRIAVMYAGQIVEEGPAENVLGSPRHPYTQSLVAAATELDRRPRRLTEIRGEPLLAAQLAEASCAFEPRCPAALATCKLADPGLRNAGPAAVRCVLYPDRLHADR